MTPRLITTNALALTLLSGCVFDASGVTPTDLAAARDGAMESAPDRAVPPSDAGDAAVTDGGQILDQQPPDLMVTSDKTTPVDKALPPDAKAVVPITASALGQALSSAKVPCIDMQGASDGTTIPVADSAAVTFLPGSATLANAPTALKSWVQGKPAATVMWDPNACDDEWPLSSGTTWTQAGFIIRGATINSSGQLVLTPGVTVADMNILDVYSNGGYEQEVFGVDDSGLLQHPPLIQPVNKAKQLILQLAGL